MNMPGPMVGPGRNIQNAAIDGQTGFLFSAKGSKKLRMTLNVISWVLFIAFLTIFYWGDYLFYLKMPASIDVASKVSIWYIIFGFLGLKLIIYFVRDRVNTKKASHLFENTNTKTCQYCGKLLNLNDKICPHCGLAQVEDKK